MFENKVLVPIAMLLAAPAVAELRAKSPKTVFEDPITGPCPTLTLLKYASPVVEKLEDVKDPLIESEPEIWTLFPAANIKFLRFESSVPFPSINAPSVELVILYKPCTC